MNTNDYLLKYLKSVSDDPIKELIDNSMYYMFANEFKEFETDDHEWKKVDRAFSLLNKYTLDKIAYQFNAENIKYVSFKGILLSFQLYDDISARKLGDIDIFVDESNFEKALSILIGMGYVTKYKNELCNQHHVVLVNNNTVLELHRNIFHPMLNIDESYLLNNNCCKMGIKTFNTTATFLHLIYHLYMDTYLVSGILYHILVNKAIPKAGRFLYRAYEIALFSEKYSVEINWTDIEKDIKNQKFRVFFKKMIFDILEIFPEAFPQSFMHTVCNLNYVNDERDYLYKYFIESNMNNGNNFDVLLIDYINNNWESRRENNIHKKVGENISLVKKSSNEIYKDLSCDITTEITTEGLKISFKVSNDDFYISDIGDYNTQTSDGVHLLLCGTEQYSYNSIFLFPKKIDGEIKVIVCDVLNNRNDVLGDNLIKADFSKTESDYTITAILSNQFLKENYLSSYLYMGLVISDCSSETHHRKNELILSEKSSEWYNPTYFAKIDIK